MATRPIYRKIPALVWKGNPNLSDAGKEGRCSRLTGHSLIMSEGKIECKDCGATWKEEK